MVVVYQKFSKTFASVCLVSLFSLASYGSSGIAKAQTLKSYKLLSLNQQENLIKCGWQKQINLRLPLWHLLAKTPKREGGRVEVNHNRCGIKLPIRLTALIPESNIGITVAEYPTFFFYIPKANLERVERVELAIVDKNNNLIYEKELSLKLKYPNRIVSIDLSNSPSLPALKVGESYYWIFSVGFDEVDRSGDAYVQGWIKRVSLDSTLQHKLDTALPQEKPAIYASNGIWFDALTSLAKLRCSYPYEATFRSDWESLLQQVGLQEIAKKPLAQCN